MFTFKKLQILSLMFLTSTCLHASDPGPIDGKWKVLGETCNGEDVPYVSSKIWTFSQDQARLESNRDGHVISFDFERVTYDNNIIDMTCTEVSRIEYPSACKNNPKLDVTTTFVRNDKVLKFLSPPNIYCLTGESVTSLELI